MTLSAYRDCAGGGAAFDDPVTLFIYEATSGNLERTLTINLGTVTDVSPDLSDPCLLAPPIVCVERTAYNQIVNLPPLPGGYYVVYQRCCRNNTIINLAIPGSTGSTYVAFIPDPGTTSNSSPLFNDQPPLIICRDEPLVFDHSATDPDGDLLVYELCTPFEGASPGCPQPAGPISTLPGCPSDPGAPPYLPVIFSPPYSAAYPLDAAPGLAIDPVSGMLTGTPQVEGQFVVGICAKEYRAGVLIATHTRDFQFNVVNCDRSIVAATAASVINCDDFTVTFANFSSGASSYFWDFGVPGAFSTTAGPTFTYPDTGTYTVTLIAEPGVLCTDTFRATVGIYPGMDADFSALPACPGAPTLFTDLTTHAFGNLASWRWSFGDGTLSNLPDPSRSYNSGGVYPVELIARTDLGCTDTARRDVVIPFAPALDAEAGLACLDQPVLFTDASTLLGGSIVDQSWNFGDGSTGSGSPVSHVFAGPGEYPVQLVVTGSNGCSSDTTIDVLVRPLVVAEILPGDTICEGEAWSLLAAGGLSYAWTPPEGLSDPMSFNPIANPITTTTYSVVVSDGCSADTAEATVWVLPAPNVVLLPGDTSILNGETVQLLASGGVGYTWFPPDSLTDPNSPSPVANPALPTEYTVQVLGANGCATLASVFINVRPRCNGFIMPNAFTPDGDGRNDVFRAKRLGDDVLLNLSVFDRWGQRMFQSTEDGTGWDGTVRGKPQEMGTYLYVLRSQCAAGTDQIAGTVTLIR